MAISYGTYTITDELDGSQIWTTTTAPTTPNYTFTISNLVGNTNTDIKVGDIILYSYYRYNVIEVGATTVRADTQVSLRGATGPTGLNNATVTLYKRASSTPALPSGNVTYTFSTGKATNNLNGWSQNIPSGTDHLYAITAVASANTATDTIPTTEWQPQTPAVVMENGVSGYNQATIFLYQRKAGTAPSKPTTSATYTFSTGKLNTVPSGWSTSIPSGTNPCYVTTGVAISQNSTYTITTWTDVIKLVEDGISPAALTVSKTEYQSGTSNTTPPTGSWNPDNPVTVAEGNYLWTKVTYSDGSYSYSVAKQGKSGNSVTVKSTVYEYQLSTSGTTVPTGTWETTPQAPTVTQYAWTRTTTTFSDNSEVVTYTVGGKTGVSVTNIQQTTTSTADSGTNVVTVTLSDGTTKTFEIKNGSGGDDGQMLYATSGTGASTAAKVATLSSGSISSLIAGTIVAVKFTYANTATTPTLNVNSKGAKTIKSYTGAALASAEYSWKAGACIVFVYDGSYWRMVDSGTLTAVDAAQTTANNAMTAANGKNKVFHQPDQPTSTSDYTLQKGDTWFDTNDGYKMWQWDGDSWEPEQYGTNAIADVAITSAKIGNLAVTNAKIADATIESGKIKALDVGKLTGGYIAADHIDVGNIIQIGSIATTAQVSNAKNEAINTAAQNAQEKIDNIEIGGRNLFRETAFLGKTILSNNSSDLTFTKDFVCLYNNPSAYSFTSFNESINQIEITLNNSSNLGIAFKRLASEIDLDSSSYYTISCWAKCTKESSLAIGLTYYTTADKWIYRGGTNAQSFSAVNTWQKFTLSFKPDADTKGICYCFTCNGGVSGGTDKLYLRQCKLEKGNKATDWTPAPEDVNDTISNIEIGGRNYLRNTETFSGWTNCGSGTAGTFNNDGTYTFPVVTTTSWTEIRPNANVDYSLVRNRTLVFSAEVKGTAGQQISVMMDSYVSATATGDRVKYRNSHLSPTGGTGNTSSNALFSATGDWQKVYTVVDITDDFFSSGTGTINYDSCFFGARLARVSTSYNSYMIRRPCITIGNHPTDWSPAIEDIVTSEQYIYIQAVSGTNSVSKNETWVTATGESTASDTAGLTPVWTTKRPTYRSKYPVIFVAKQTRTLNGTVTCTTPLKDDTTTVIDGGHITTGTIDANKVTVANIDATNIKAGTLSAERIQAGSIEYVKLSDTAKQAIKDSAENMLLDVYVPSLTAVNGPSDRYLSDASRTTTGEFKTEDNLPDPNATHFYRMTYGNGARGLCWYVSNFVPLQDAVKYRIGCYARKVSGNPRLNPYIGNYAYDNIGYYLTDDWKWYETIVDFRDIKSTANTYKRIYYYCNGASGDVLDMCGWKVTRLDEYAGNGDNLLLESNVQKSNSNYNIASYYFGEDKPKHGDVVTLTLKGSLGSGKTGWGIYNSGGQVGCFEAGNWSLSNLWYDNTDGTYKATFTWKEYNPTGTQVANNTHLNIYASPNSVTGVTSTIEWIKLERGSIATPWCLNSIERINGGRNLLLGSKDFSSESGNNQTGITKTTDTYQGVKVLKGVWSSGNMDMGRFENKFSVALEPNTDYTLSFWAKGETAMTAVSYLFTPSTVVSGKNSSGNVTTSTDGAISTNITTTWKRHWITWHTSNATSQATSLIVARRGAAGTIYIAGVKFEKGTTPTDWSPAPEDTSEAIEKAQSSADGKNTVFYNTEDNVPDGIKVGDTWFVQGHLNLFGELYKLPSSWISSDGTVTITNNKNGTYTMTGSASTANRWIVPNVSMISGGVGNDNNDRFEGMKRLSNGTYLMSLGSGVSGIRIGVVRYTTAGSGTGASATTANATSGKLDITINDSYVYNCVGIWIAANTTPNVTFTPSIYRTSDSYTTIEVKQWDGDSWEPTTYGDECFSRIDAGTITTGELRTIQLKGPNEDTYWDLSTGEWQSHGTKIVEYPYHHPALDQWVTGEWQIEANVNIDDGVYEITGSHDNSNTTYATFGIASKGFDPATAISSDIPEPYAYAGLELRGDKTSGKGGKIIYDGEGVATGVEEATISYIPKGLYEPDLIILGDSEDIPENPDKPSEDDVNYFPNRNRLILNAGSESTVLSSVEYVENFYVQQDTSSEDYVKKYHYPMSWSYYVPWARSFSSQIVPYESRCEVWGDMIVQGNICTLSLEITSKISRGTSDGAYIFCKLDDWDDPESFRVAPLTSYAPLSGYFTKSSTTRNVIAYVEKISGRKFTNLCLLFPYQSLSSGNKVYVSGSYVIDRFDAGTLDW